ncbi:MAG: patatin-like phospholipase family protein [Methyloligellaceae bacterium]
MEKTQRHYEQADFEGEKPVCDIVMKGGITSGVVYPLAVIELAKRYRIENIGGTSAGALAAALTAAAEYGREKRGYLKIAEIPDEIAPDLISLFQPVPKLKPLFALLLSLLGEGGRTAKIFRVLGAALRGYAAAGFLGALPGLLVIIGAVFDGLAGLWPFGILLAIVGATASILWRIYRALTRELPENGFGMCTGLRQPGHAKPALTEWLADRIDGVAGLTADGAEPSRPLTFGDLVGPDPKRPRINLAVITTNLSMRRPYRLPLREKTYLFRRSEFAQLFPERVVAHMTENTPTFPSGEKQLKDFYYFPDDEHLEDLPVVVAARMSLSFPGLISAVPLYTRDFTLEDEAEQQVPRLCWFSDGGLSSNFPIHFFDRLWPNAPTFAIALEEYVEARHGAKRVRMPRGAREGILLPIHQIGGLGQFLMTLLNAAKDWQDNLQSVLPGYRERVVHVALKPDEGGLNLTMPPLVIRQLTELGGQAGETAGTKFDMDEHRWRRFLIAMARLEETLDELADAYDQAPTGCEPFKDFLDRYGQKAQSYKQKSGWFPESRRRADAAVDLAKAWRASPRIREGKIPRPDTDMRITPRE